MPVFVPSGFMILLIVAGAVKVLMHYRHIEKGCSAVTVYGMTGAKELVEVVEALLKVKEVMPDDIQV